MQDLFENYEILPENVKAILDKYSSDSFTKEAIEAFETELEKQGYTFDYWLDCVPYNLRELLEITDVPF